MPPSSIILTSQSLNFCEHNKYKHMLCLLLRSFFSQFSSKGNKKIPPNNYPHLHLIINQKCETKGHMCIFQLNSIDTSRGNSARWHVNKLHIIQLTLDLSKFMQGTAEKLLEIEGKIIQNFHVRS